MQRRVPELGRGKHLNVLTKREITVKKALFALAAAGTCAISGVASAQTASTVTLYGIADAGVEFATHTPGGNGGTVARVSSGNMSGSRWGLRLSLIHI